MHEPDFYASHSLRSNFPLDEILKNMENERITDVNYPTRSGDGLRKKHRRRCNEELEKDFICLYNCGKSYATDAARNKHMRDKHNDVTKTERERKARDIIVKFSLKNSQDIVSRISQLTMPQQV